MRKRNCDLEILLSVFFVLCICTFGMFYEFCGAIWTVILSVATIAYCCKRKTVSLRLTVGLCVYLLFLIGYLITIPYAVDAGMAFLGLGRILWIGPFLFLFQQLNEFQRQRFFTKIPWFGGGFTFLGLAADLFPTVKAMVYVNHRLGGPFQYPNTFALFLLIGIIMVLHAENNWKNIACFILLCIGIAASGSRTVMLLSIAVILLWTVSRKNWRFLTVLLVLGAFGLLYIMVTKDTDSIGRILRVSLSESTFVGRILYARDALPLLIGHPFGMGHLGYYYSENMIQTGMYTVRYLHNDWLQIGLDIGWIPMLIYLLAVLRCVFGGKGLDASGRWVLTVMFLHGLLDFDLSYTVMLCLLLLLMNEMPLWRKERGMDGYRLPRMPLVCGLVFCVFLGCYLTIPTLAEYQENDSLAAKLYPWDTEVNLRMISRSGDIREVEELADIVLRQNDTCALAYYAKAYAAYCRDDYDNVIRYQREAIARDYFNYEEYRNYALMLYEGMEAATSESSREQCRAELCQIPNLLKEAEKQLSLLGKKIRDQPELVLDEQLQEMLDIAGQLDGFEGGL